ncbi:probable E3 ubiquitin-protein ligase ARI2 isoform X2 [Asparagus officinalis]|uniref:probable E3 ubiquitin-protein ligase ARI2 isoform X2 n=1 Tax=Asparagus officinalis TaxID=4686 RepID=UPI00098E69E0|nr:probable E3 ubiquitin-protein ligase ARI2 isoform X2 [Asparagus officinalis]
MILELDGIEIVQVITEDTLLLAQKEDLGKVMDLFALSEQHARTLLIYYRWDVERVLEIFEKKGRDMMFLDAGVMIENKGAILASSSGEITCGICFDDVSRDAATVMDCGHYFCDDCWTEHFIVRIKEGQSRRIKCMASNCNAICDEFIVRSLVSKRNPDIADKFDRCLLESYIDDNKRVKWCPSTPHCGNAICVKDDLLCEVECTCGHQFCFSCLLEAHSPCSCLIWDLWSKKCNTESENIKWIVTNTKPCPKCLKSVDKNGGCNLVVCVCGQAFCWLCGGATGREHTWTSITGHSCNRYKNDNTKKKEHTKKNHYRFVHYHDRYKAHTDSLNQESKQRNTLLEKISMSENKESEIKDYSWALNGMSRLFRSRRVLTYTYPFAYYMFGDELFQGELSNKEREMKKNLFEDQQQQLEGNVERLSMNLEKDFQFLTDAKIDEIKMNVLDLSRIVDFLCLQMYKCIEHDLLEPLGNATHQIAPYKSNGVERAPELSIYLDHCAEQGKHVSS